MRLESYLKKQGLEGGKVTFLIVLLGSLAGAQWVGLAREIYKRTEYKCI